MTPDPPKVFISYTSADRDWAEWIAWTLDASSYSVTFQDWDIRPGQNFIIAMQEASAAARHTVLVLSPSSLVSDFVKVEWSAAVAKDPTGKQRRLIPVRVEECEPEGILGPIVYADLVGLGEEEAARVLLKAFAERAKPDEAPVFPGALSFSIASERPSFPGAAAPRVSIAKLPATGEHFVAREAELARLDAAWDDEATNVISFVAMGGTGKSALVNHWLDAVAADGWRGAERVLGWSFYSQGTESAGASSEAFTEYALEWLGYEGEPILSPWKKGEVIAGLVRERRTLLLLDGLEPLQ
ncbi:MAG: toll/interleukin-1 receptor domain-containing protein, partial [bacterium]|nr:toll/interleukin-1 receptor domain-containing protein [bacterium]